MVIPTKFNIGQNVKWRTIFGKEWRTGKIAAIRTYTGIKTSTVLYRIEESGNWICENKIKEEEKC